MVRHGQSTWNAAGRWQGTADPPLSETGLAQARECAAQLRPFGFVGVVTSDLARARVTAEVLAAELGLRDPTIDARLRERDVGEWSGLTDAEIGVRWPGEPERWRAHADRVPPGGGEPAAASAGRLAEALRAAARVHAPGPVLVVSHGGVLRALVRRLGAAEEHVGNLGGRWFGVGPTGLACGPRFVPPWEPDAGGVSSRDARDRSGPRV